jgi:predicted RNA binding protein YcfA (HicA-like mRNA interferase family)
LNLKKLEKLLRDHGCRKVGEGGGHSVWENAKGTETTIPRHKEIKKFTARGICKTLGVDPKNVRD